MATVNNQSVTSVDNEVKKPVWSKPLLNGVVETVSPVMGALSWPALKDSFHTLSDASLMPALQGTESVNLVLSKNNVTDSEGGGSSCGYLLSEGGVSESESAKDSQQNGGNEHRRQQNAYRRGNGKPNSRGGGKLEQGRGRGNQEWNQSRSFNNRDGIMQFQRGGYRRGGFIRPSVLPNSGPFGYPPMRLPMRPFGNNVMYPDVASAMVYFQGPAPPMVPGPQYFPFPDPLHGTIVKQIEYYFSNENLVKDTFLRQKMDDQGWVPVNLIAGFKKVLCLTNNVQLILDVMRQSTVVEVQGDKMRRRNDWMRWLMPPAVQDSLASQLQGIVLDSRPSSGELISQMQPGGGEP